LDLPPLDAALQNPSSTTGKNRLLIDVGNGRTKFGLARGGSIFQRGDCETPGLNGERLTEVIAGWQFDQVVLASVVPAVLPIFKDHFGVSLIELNHRAELGIGIRYPNPESIGADRLANAIALADLHGAPGIVIDFGTAVTFDVLSADRHYIGGVIAPGLRLMTDYLNERTALLPQVTLHEPTKAIGKSTEEAILAGAAIGYRGMIRGILEALRCELGEQEVRLVATGGDAEWIVGGLGEPVTVDPDLTLHGLRILGERSD